MIADHVGDHALHVGMRLGDDGLVDTDLEALHRVAEVGDVVGHRHGRGGGVARIGAGQQAQAQRQVLHVAGDQADGVERGRQRHGAGAADAAPGRLDGGDAAAGGRQAQRAAGVGAEAHRDGAIGDGAGGAGGGAAGDAGRVPGVAGVAQHIVVACRAVGELGQMQRGDVERAGLPESGDDRGVLRGRLVVAQLGAPARDPALAVEHVLVRQRHAGERARRCALGDGGVGGLGGGEGLVGLQRDDAVGELMRRAQALDGGRGRLHARHGLVADGLGERAG